MKILSRVLLPFSLLIFFTSCKDETSSSKDLEVDEAVIEQAAFGFEMNEIVNTSQDISDLTGESDLLEENEFDNDLFPSLGALKHEARDLIKLAAKKYSLYNSKNNTISDDTLAFFHDDTTHGTRIYIGYNTNSGMMRLYSVKYDKFFAWQVKTYDSTEIKVDYNNTFEDDSDDKLVSIDNLIKYKNTFFIQSVVSQILVTDYEETEPSGLIMTRDSYYIESRSLQHLSQTIEINPDDSGTLREDFTFANGSTAFNSITFFNDQTGEFSKQFRNGTTVSGTFDSAEEDNVGSWTEQIDFPAGRYIDQIHRDAQVFILEDLFEATFNQQIIFSSGRIDSSSINIQIDENDDVTTTVINAEKANGAFGTFTITEYEESKEMVGEWTTWNGYFIESEAEWYEDGSSHLVYRVYAPPYQVGDEPIIVAEYYFSPDGSADGTLVHEAITYLIKLNDNLKGEISHDGKRTEFNLFQ